MTDVRSIASAKAATIAMTGRIVIVAATAVIAALVRIGATARIGESGTSARSASRVRSGLNGLSVRKDARKVLSIVRSLSRHRWSRTARRISRRRRQCAASALPPCRITSSRSFSAVLCAVRGAKRELRPRKVQHRRPRRGRGHVGLILGSACKSSRAAVRRGSFVFLRGHVVSRSRCRDGIAHGASRRPR